MGGLLSSVGWAVAWALMLSRVILGLPVGTVRRLLAQDCGGCLAGRAAAACGSIVATAAASATTRVADVVCSCAAGGSGGRPGSVLLVLVCCVTMAAACKPSCAQGTATSPQRSQAAEPTCLLAHQLGRLRISVGASTVDHLK